MRKKTQTVKLEDVHIDPDIYPRLLGIADWPTVAKYTAAMRNGDQFPPIHVSKDPKGGWISLDGWHRVRAAKGAGKKEFNAIVYSDLPRKKWRYLAAQLNSKHGRILSVQERRMLNCRLQQDGIPIKEIAKVLAASVADLKTWSAMISRDKDGNPIVPKSAVIPAMGTINEKDALANSGPIANANVRRTLDEMLGLLRGHLVDPTDPAIRDRVVDIHRMLGELLKKKKVG